MLRSTNCPKRSQCEHKPYPSYKLQRSLLISKDHLGKQGSVAISATIKVFRPDSDRFKNLSDTERSTFNSGAVLFRSRKCFESGVSSVNRSPIRYTFCDAPFHYPVQCEHSLRLGNWLGLKNAICMVNSFVFTSVHFMSFQRDQTRVNKFA